ncbi:MAG: DUF1697 domain-containing protein [Myxococcales bacterium]|nr:DUF1697 domain-containing protein [Myxococcales bacterium]
MQTFIALLRAINVGGTGKLPMADLVRICETAGFSDVKTYIQSGNVVFKSDLEAGAIQALIEDALAKKVGKPVGVQIRRAADFDRLLAENPFKKAPPNQVIVMFFDEPPPKDALAEIRSPGGEELQLRGRELYIHYPNGQGRSKLKIPFAAAATGRNINTVAKLAAMARELSK